MPSPDEIGVAARDAATAYGVEEYVAGVASQQPRIDDLEHEVDGLTALVDTLEDEIVAALNRPGPEYTEVKAADLQAALDAGIWAYVNDEHDFTTTLLIPKPGCHIWLGDNAVLWRNFSSPKGPTRSALVGNRDWSGPTTGVISIRGTGKIQARPGMAGNVLSLWGDTIELFDFGCDYFTDGRWFMGGSAHAGRAGGEIARVAFTCDPNASSGTGGIRWATGGCYVHDIYDSTSADDFAQAVPAGNPSDPLFNAPDVDGLTYSTMRRNRSLDGRLGVEGLQDKNDDGTTRLGMKSGVHNVHWEHFDGWGGKSGFVHQNKSSTGTITGTTTLDVVIDQADADAGQRAEVYLNGVPSTGGIDGVDLSGVTILNPRSSKLPFATDGKVTNVIPPAA